jgi:hypothetical protein
MVWKYIREAMLKSNRHGKNDKYVSLAHVKTKEVTVSPTVISTTS